MKLQQTRIIAKLTQKEFLEQVQQNGSRIDKPMYSKIENGVVLPTVDQMIAFCKVLECMPLDLYEKEEIDLIHCMDAQECATKRKKDGHKISRKATFRVPDWCCNWLEPQVLQYLGYTTAQQWFLDMVKRTQDRYERRKRKEEETKRAVCEQCVKKQDAVQCKRELSA